MKHLTILALAGLAAIGTPAVSTVVSREPTSILASTSGRLRQNQHDARMPEHLYGVWIHIVGAPGTEYQLFVRFDDGTTMLVGLGVIAPWGSNLYAWYGPHDHVQQRHVQVEVWSVSTEPVRAQVVLWD